MPSTVVDAMDRILGILPAGGRARRIHGFFKELMPIGVNELNRSQFVVTSQRLIDSMLHAGALSVNFVLSSEKSFVAEYFAREDLFRGRVNFNYLAESIHDLGMPYTIDSIWDQARAFECVLMAMPDTVIDPTNSFEVVLKLLSDKQADLALGLFRTDRRNRGGFVEFDQMTRRVTGHVDKTSPDFPDSADNSWAVAAWNTRFTEFMHAELASGRLLPRRNARVEHEVLFGDVIDLAMADRSVIVVADYVDETSGFYWDITEPDKYFDLLRFYSPDDRAQTVVANPRVDLLLASLRRLGGGGARSLVLRRRAGRPTIRIDDEHDVQDLVEAIVRCFFDDVRTEEPSPSRAGSSSRMDLFLPGDEIAIEAKVVSRGRRPKQIKREILEDINDYRGHEKVRTLIVVVYDLVGDLVNPSGFEADLSGIRDGLRVFTVVVPWVGCRASKD